MARDGVDEHTAFEMLVARAGQSGSTVHEVARSTIDTAVRRGR
jgi:hypothetical protein